MKVGVFLGDRPPDMGGGYTFQQDIFESLGTLAQQSRHRFVVFGSHRYGELYGGKAAFKSLEFVEYKRPGVLQRALGAAQRDLPFLRIAWPTRRALDKAMYEHGIDIAWFVTPTAMPIDVPYITTVWDLMHLTHPWFPEVAAGKDWISRDLSFRELLRRATFVVTGTESGRTEIERFYQVPRERIRLLRHPTPRFALHAPNGGSVAGRFGISGKFLLYPAQFWPHKNHVLLLEVLSYLRQKGTHDFSLVFAGSDKGNLEFVRSKTAQYGLQDKVFFLGFVSVEDLIGRASCRERV